MYRGVMQLIVPITSPCRSLTTVSTQILGIMMSKLKIIERKLIKPKHFLLENRSTRASENMDPSAPVKLIHPVNKP